ncbi:flagellar hook-length control protein FliK [Kushneria sp. EE4]
MLTPINAQITSQGSTSANTKGSEGDNGFGALLNDTKARHNDNADSTATADARTQPPSRQQARADHTGSDEKGRPLKGDGRESVAEGRRPAQMQVGNTRQTLSSTLEQLQGNRLENRDRRDEATSQRISDRTLTDQTSGDARQASIAALADGRQMLEPLGTERVGSRLAGAEKQAASRVDARAEAPGDKSRRLTDSEQTDDKSPLYALMDTGFLMQPATTQKAPAGREGALPARSAMLEQGLRGRDAAASDDAAGVLKAHDKDGGKNDRLFGELLQPTRNERLSGEALQSRPGERFSGDALQSRTGERFSGEGLQPRDSSRLFGEILQQREGPLFRTGGDTLPGAHTAASAPSDSPMNTLSALTGQTGTGSMAPSAAQAVTTATLPAMDSDQWSTALERQTINLSMRGGGEARLNMNPLELGPLSISLKMGEQSAQLHIASHHAQVRAAVEAALPQLREAFSANGIELGQASVSDQGSFQQGGFQQQQERTPGALAGRNGPGSVAGLDADADNDVISISALPGRSLNGGIDLFA